MKAEIKSGERFGRWAILRFDRLYKSCEYWLCRCDCGRDKSVLRRSLESGLSRSCGCLCKELKIAGRVDHTGKRFGRLMAIRYVDSKNGARWLFRCDCGNERIMRPAFAVTGIVKSCGCWKAEKASQFHRRHGASGKKENRNATYTSWGDMRQRCLNPNTKQFKDYGGRGITVCIRWKESFEDFRSDMGECPPGLTIERINNEGNYEPGNCTWIPRSEQAKNRRPQFNEQFFTLEGKTMNLRAWAKEIGVNYGTLAWRIRTGWPVEKALTTPARPFRGGGGGRGRKKTIPPTAGR